MPKWCASNFIQVQNGQSRHIMTDSRVDKSTLKLQYHLKLSQFLRLALEMDLGCMHNITSLTLSLKDRIVRNTEDTLCKLNSHLHLYRYSYLNLDKHRYNCSTFDLI